VTDEAKSAAAVVPLSCVSEVNLLHVEWPDCGTIDHGSGDVWVQQQGAPSSAKQVAAGDTLVVFKPSVHADMRCLCAAVRHNQTTNKLALAAGGQS